MKFFKKIYVLNFFSILCFCIITLTIINKSVNTHIHILGNGKLIIHAHPFGQQNEDNNSQEPHKHSGLEYLALDGFDIFNNPNFSFSLTTLTSTTSEKNYFVKTLLNQSYSSYKQNKSPPLLNSYRSIKKISTI